MSRQIKFIGHAYLWFDRINGNTYHSVEITRCRDGAVLYAPYQYGYGECYRQTALEAMSRAKWLPRKYRGNRGVGLCYLYERENNYPIQWITTDSTKRECIAHGVK